MEKKSNKRLTPGMRTALKLKLGREMQRNPEFRKKVHEIANKKRSESSKG